MHCVDLGESFPTSIYLTNLASIQPRTSLVKFARSSRTDPPGARTKPHDVVDLGRCHSLTTPRTGLRHRHSSMPPQTNNAQNTIRYGEQIGEFDKKRHARQPMSLLQSLQGAPDLQKKSCANLEEVKVRCAELNSNLHEKQVSQHVHRSAVVVYQPRPGG